MTAVNKKLPVVAIIGRTNVGKSTLFNALHGKRVSVVDDFPGVTRDRHYSTIQRPDFSFTLIDTGGLFGEEDPEFADPVHQQALLAIEEADVIVAVFDGIYGLHPYDTEVIHLLRECDKPVLWVVNKCEKKEVELSSGEFYGSGIDDLLTISAAHRRGITELLAKLKKELPKHTWKQEEEEELQNQEDTPIRVAILGKPNVGKSTLVNKILGEERIVTSAIAGTTRDSIHTSVKREGQQYTLIDTAGLRKRAKVSDQSLERFSNFRTLRSLVLADIAVLLLDATEKEPTDQDLRIARLIHERGKGFVIVVNKWDQVEKDHKSSKEYEKKVYEKLMFAHYAPVIFVSAQTGRRCPSVLKTVKTIYQTAQKRLQTSDLNRVIGRAFEKHPPPIHRGQPVKFFFGTQVAVSPPTIVIFVNYPRKITDPYQRYLQKQIRRFEPFEGIALKLMIRKRSEKGNEKVSMKAQ